MKRFILYVLSTMIGLLIVNFIVFYTLEYPRKQYFNTLLKVKPSERSYYFFFGDSHVWDFMNAIDNPKYLNFAHPSDNSKDISSKLGYLLDQGILSSEDTVFIQFDANNFTAVKEQSNNNDLTDDMNDLKMNAWHYLPLLSNDKVVSFESMLSVYRWLSDYKQQDYQFDSAKSVRRLKQQFGDFSYSESARENYESMINLLQNQGVKTYLLKMPIYKQYLEIINKNFTYPDIEGVKIIDFSRENLQESDFTDQDHLNENGAKKIYLKLKSNDL
ncbi:hypothetical protein [Penaeicola halotolerans]|uniref:hypothetical protein n=1 Tax=Penaeicola halotolerans TaxID=2793196 RepID=UPI001CF85AF3|nr:hypothetical protein [Penaeicola halotolerans]